MSDITRKCDHCGRELTVTNVTDGAGTKGYMIGCIPCGLDDSGGTIYSSTAPQRGNADTSVHSM